MQCIGNRSSALAPHVEARWRGQWLHFALDLVELADIVQGVRSDLAFVRDMQIVELAPCVRHAAKFSDALRKQRLVAGEVITYEAAPPITEECLRVLAGSTVGEVVDHRLQSLEGTRAIRPEIRALRLAFAGAEHRHRCLIGMQHSVLQNLLLERIHQRLQLHTARANPLGERRARNRQAGAFKDAFLSVQRNMIAPRAVPVLWRRGDCERRQIESNCSCRSLHLKAILAAGPLGKGLPLTWTVVGHASYRMQG
ncbi:hypothetical protein BCO71033_07389 [Burkholderia contaminans]|uniref:Uncharacterized protein n=1 Tax=Burkholderia contaminans TaxID=488447 RepID=A0A6P3CBT3_9BURK|nr:hypothetical protein BCO71033_07389 [Burkholderia contaminans]